MANLYEVFQPASQAPFQQGYWGAAWGNAFGEVKDQIVAETKFGVMARFPQVAPLDALGEIAIERQMFQGPTETTAHFIARLLNAWGAWSIGGTYWGLLAQLHGMGYSTAWIIATNGYAYGSSDNVEPPDPINDLPGTPPSYVRLPPWYTNGGDLAVYPPWNFDGSNGQGQPGNYDALISPTGPVGPRRAGVPNPEGDFWSRFIVMLSPLPGTWTDVVNPPTATSAPGSGEIALLSDLIAAWKPAKTFCAGILAMPGGSATWAWPPSVTTNIASSCFLARAIFQGDAPTSTAFVPQYPNTVNSWLPGQTIATPGGSSYAFMMPSFATIKADGAGTGWVYSSPSGGTTGLVEPTWPTMLGSTVADGDITWTAVARVRTWSSLAGSPSPTIFQLTEQNDA